MWRNGDRSGAGFAALTGTLAVSDTNCVGVTSDSRSDSVKAVVWPRGWYTGRENGKAAVYDADGDLYAKEGDKVSLPGVNGDPAYGDHPCADNDPPFKVNNSYTVPVGP